MELEEYIAKDVAFSDLPSDAKHSIASSRAEYARLILQYSLEHQLRWKKHLVKMIVPDELQYYQQVVEFSLQNQLLYPYHLGAAITIKLRLSAFEYYHDILCTMLKNDRSYDSLPNFTAADCYQIIGVGRNEFIEVLNQSKAGRGIFRRRINPSQLLPTEPKEINVQYWWTACIGPVTRDDIKLLSDNLRRHIDTLIDKGPSECGLFPRQDVMELFQKGLIWFHVPIHDNDCIIIPPLEGFIMNRTQGDYLEKLLYQISVSVDENASISDLAELLELDKQQVKDAVSVFVRLGFAVKRGHVRCPTDKGYHISWHGRHASSLGSTNDSISNEANLIDLDDVSDSQPDQRIAFIFDSSLTAFLMMGNLSPGMKKHAVTMFEAGKISDERLDGLLKELDLTPEAQEHTPSQECHTYSLALRDTLDYLRKFGHLMKGSDDSDVQSTSNRIDLLRCESMNALDKTKRSRVLERSYSTILTMAPLAPDVPPLESTSPLHLGPPCKEVSTFWFKLYLSIKLKQKDFRILFRAGEVVTSLPELVLKHAQLSLTTLGHVPVVHNTNTCLININDLVCSSPVLVEPLVDSTTEVFFPLPSIDFATKKLTSLDTSDDNLESSSQTEQDQMTSSQRSPRTWNVDTEDFLKWLKRQEALLKQINQLLDEADININTQLSVGFMNTATTHSRQDSGNEGQKETTDQNDLLEFEASDENGNEQKNVFDEEEKITGIYDITFGLPLGSKFAHLAILMGLEERRFLQESHREKVVNHSVTLTEDIRTFIREHTDDDVGNDDIIPYATQSLYYDGSTLSTLT